MIDSSAGLFDKLWELLRLLNGSRCSLRHRAGPLMDVNFIEFPNRPNLCVAIKCSNLLTDH
jgi:hypothetical protein